MEGLNPSLAAILLIRWRIERGDSIKKALRHVNHQRLHPRVDRLLIQLLSCAETQGDLNLWLSTQKISPDLEQLCQILIEGLRGEPIGAKLSSLQVLIMEKSDMELDEKVSAAPIHALLPLLLFQFPAILLLLLMPLLDLTAF